MWVYPICGRCWNYEASLIEHIIDRHFLKPRGRFIGELPIDAQGKLERCFYYSLVCWCGWNAFDVMISPFIRSDFSMAKIAVTLHSERCGGVENHWIDWKLKNLGEELPP